MLEIEIVLGVLKSIRKVQEFFECFGYCVLCFDHGYNLRKNIRKSYKAKRTAFQPQEDLELLEIFDKAVQNLKEIYLPMIGFRNVFYQEGYEADDVIASVCNDIYDTDDEGIIITRDKDLWQCVRNNVIVFDPITRKRVTAKSFYNGNGIVAKKYWIVKALAGCDSDNVKGIERVGEQSVFKFLSARLPVHHQVYSRIQKNYMKFVKKNAPLVKLPFEGIESFTINEDSFTEASWNRFLECIGIADMPNIFRMVRRRKSLI